MKKNGSSCCGETVRFDLCQLHHGAVLITVSVLCVVLGLGSIVVSTPCLRESVVKCLKRGKNKERVHAEKVAVVVDGDIQMTQRKEI